MQVITGNGTTLNGPGMLPGTSSVVDMNVKNVGTWLFGCDVQVGLTIEKMNESGENYFPIVLFVETSIRENLNSQGMNE